jgi:2-keto-4-pentenoate hydratase/2-oxohepta-3-ene-1,7-dioic acid hydratase in catechol pathway
MKTIKLISSPENESLITPSKILCIGRNYVDHIHELANEVPDQMVVFFKPNSAITAVLKSHHLNDILHYEAELCFLYQSGEFSSVALGLDLTKRAVQSQLKAKGLPWERAKSFDGSAVFSDFIAIEKEQMDNLSLTLSINGELTQQGGVPLMMIKPAEILKELTQFVSLEDGDIVMTGTPKGVGVINSKDTFVGSVLLSEGVDTNTTPKELISKKWRAQ